MSNSHKEGIKANASEETLLVSYNTSSLTTSSVYQKYENDQWLMTIGSSHGIGASNSYASRLTLGPYFNLMAFNSSITGSSQYLTALIYKNSISHLTSISLSRGNSYGSYLSTDAYLVTSSTLDGNYELVTTIDSIGTSATTYSFPTISESCYYAIVFYNPNGSFIIGGLNINFYVQEALSYLKVTSANQLYFGATYTFMDETSQKVISIHEGPNGFSGLSTNVINSQIEDELNLLKFKLDVGIIIDTYSFQIVNGPQNDFFLAINDSDELITNFSNLESSAFNLSFEGESILLFRNNQFLVYDQASNEYIFSSSPSNLSLYVLNEPVDHFEEVHIFSNQVNTRGEDASGHCEETYQFLNSIYLRLSEEAVNQFLTSTSKTDINARNRMMYLDNWYNNAQVRSKVNVTQNKNLPIYLMSGVSLLSLMLYEYIKNRKPIDWLA